MEARTERLTLINARPGINVENTKPSIAGLCRFNRCVGAPAALTPESGRLARRVLVFFFQLLGLLLLFGRIHHPHKSNAEANEKDNENNDDSRAGGCIDRDVFCCSLGVRGAIKKKKGKSGKESGHDASRLLDNGLFSS